MIIIIIIIIIIIHLAMVFHWSLSDSKFPQESRTLDNIPTELNNSVVWIV